MNPAKKNRLELEPLFFGGFNDSYGIHHIFDDTSRFFGEGRFLEPGFFAQKKPSTGRLFFFNKAMNKEIGISWNFHFIALRTQMTFWVSRIGFQILRFFFCNFCS